MAAKINKTVTISYQNGYGPSRNVPLTTGVLGGGTNSQGKGAGFKTKNSKGGAPVAQGPGYNTAQGIQGSKGKMK